MLIRGGCGGTGWRRTQISYNTDERCPGCDDQSCPVPNPKCPACDDTGMVKHTPGYYCECWWGRAKKDWDKDSESDHYEDEYCRLADMEDKEPKEGEDG